MPWPREPSRWCQPVADQNPQQGTGPPFRQAARSPRITFSPQHTWAAICVQPTDPGAGGALQQRAPNAAAGCRAFRSIGEQTADRRTIAKLSRPGPGLAGRQAGVLPLRKQSNGIHRVRTHCCGFHDQVNQPAGSTRLAPGARRHAGSAWAFRRCGTLQDQGASASLPRFSYAGPH